MNSTSNLLPLCKVSDIPAGQAKRIEVSSLALAIFNVDGQFYVTDDNCTHGPGLLSEGFVDGDVVECNFHNGAFHIPTGKPVSPPCTIPLRTFPVTIVDNQICIDPNAPQQEPAVS